jgi:lysophospholipase L1-like esterase
VRQGCGTTFPMRRIVPIFFLSLVSLAFGQAFQMLPPDKPENCAARSRTMEKWLLDWPQLSRYRQADSELGAPLPGEQRVVFLGDSITDSWDLKQFFPGKPYINRGISAQTTANMLLRFRQDVIDLKPKAVVILAGTNDIAGNTGPMTMKEIEDNFASMSDLARANGIAVILSSVTPVHDYTEASKRFFADRPVTEINALNNWLRRYAKRNGFVYLDYFSAMVDDKGFLKRELSDDGLHPNTAGYKIMARIAENAIQSAVHSQRGNVRK